MKKGDQARLDANWFKKNKSKRLKSSTFEALISNYNVAMITAKAEPMNVELFDDAIDRAGKAEKEAKALAGKCGIGQKETKAVLEQYVQLFKDEAKLQAQLKKSAEKYAKANESAEAADTKAAKAASDADKLLKKLARDVATVDSSLSDIVHQVYAIGNKFDDWIANKGPMQADANADALLGWIKKSLSKIKTVEKQLVPMAKVKKGTFPDSVQKDLVRLLKQVNVIHDQLNNTGRDLIGLKKKIAEKKQTAGT